MVALSATPPARPSALSASAPAVQEFIISKKTSKIDQKSFKTMKIYPISLIFLPKSWFWIRSQFRHHGHFERHLQQLGYRRKRISFQERVQQRLKKKLKYPKKGIARCDIFEKFLYVRHKNQKFRRTLGFNNGGRIGQISTGGSGTTTTITSTPGVKRHISNVESRPGETVNFN